MQARVLRRLLVICATITALAATAQPAFAVTWTVDDPSDGIQCTGANFTTISAAVAASNPLLPDIIVVCDGDYFEQVTIDRSLTLQAAQGQTPTIHFPPVTTDAVNKAIVRVTGLGGLNLGALVNVFIDGFVIAGPGNSNCDSIRAGIRVDGGATATITRNWITEIHDSQNGSGCQNGFGILVGRQSEGTTGHATIRDNIIEHYQKVGILVDNAGSTATIMDNVVIGIGRTKVIAQHGVEVARHATVLPVNFTGNTISGNFFLNSDPNNFNSLSVGILYVEAGEPGYEGPLQSTNTVRHNRPQILIIP